MAFSKYKTIIFGLAFIQHLGCMEQKIVLHKVPTLIQYCLDAIARQRGLLTLEHPLNLIYTIASREEHLPKVQDHSRESFLKKINKYYCSVFTKLYGQVVITLFDNQGAPLYQRTFLQNCSIKKHLVVNEKLFLLLDSSENDNYILKIIDIKKNYKSKTYNVWGTSGLDHIIDCDKKNLALYGDQEIVIFSIKDGKSVWQHINTSINRKLKHAVTLSDNLIVLAFLGADSFRYDAIEIWDYVKNKKLDTIDDQCECVNLISDKKSLLGWIDNGKTEITLCQINRARSFQLLATIGKNEWHSSISFDPTSSYLCSIFSNTIRLYNIKMEQWIAEFKLAWHDTIVSPVIYWHSLGNIFITCELGNKCKEVNVFTELLKYQLKNMGAKLFDLDTKKDQH